MDLVCPAEFALQHLIEQQNLKHSFHIFVDCQPAIISAFGTEIPKHNVEFDVILNIRQISSTLQNNGHSLFVHWIPVHKDFKGNELADCLAKNAAKEMIGKEEDFLKQHAHSYFCLGVHVPPGVSIWRYMIIFEGTHIYELFFHS